MKISVIGFGNMGSAIVRSWLNNKIVDPENLSIYDTDSSKLKTFSESSPIDISQDTNNIRQADIVLLAIKPQDLASIGQNYPIPESAIIISILAGMSIEKLGKALNRNINLVRTMPNLAASVGRSMTGYVTSPDLSADKISLTEKLLSAFGAVQKLASEDLMDAWCAIAGSGPGLVFYLMDKFRLGAEELGFSAALSEQLVSQVFSGSAILAEQQLEAGNHQVFEKLVKSVCSKGGTTEKAVSFFDESGLTEIIKQSLKAAENRSKELNSL